MTEEDRRNYHEEPVQHRTGARLCRTAPLAAEALIFSFPVWNFGYPAILKGYPRPRLPARRRPSRSSMTCKVATKPDTNIKKLAAVTTYGGTRLEGFLRGRPAPQTLYPRRLARHTARKDALSGTLRHEPAPPIQKRADLSGQASEREMKALVMTKASGRSIATPRPKAAFTAAVRDAIWSMDKLADSTAPKSD